MRSEAEIYDLIDRVAANDPRIRAVLLNGSRANPGAKRDRYQDYDIVFLVRDLPEFIRRPDWIEVFGKTIIVQTPDAMDIGPPQETDPTDRYAYLMLFEDHVRIDLTLVDLRAEGYAFDSLTQPLLDKDKRFADPRPASDRDYWVPRPTERQFRDCCNEFWWVSTYVVKGLLRRELLYAKGMLEGPVRDMLNLLLAWHVGVRHRFAVNLGAAYKYLPDYLDGSVWDRLVKTYSTLDGPAIWRSLNEMVALFTDLEEGTADRLGYDYDAVEMRKVKNYLRDLEPELRRVL